MNKRGVTALLLACFAWGLILSAPALAEYGDIVLNSKSESMKKADVKPVLFPHWFHRIRFKCKVCHESIFQMKKGSNDIQMGAIMEGEFCGKCHNGLVAWEPLYCDRCHSYEGQ